MGRILIMNKESKVVTNVGTIDFSKCDVTVDGTIMLFVGISDIPEDINEKIHTAVVKAKEEYTYFWDQKWGEEKIIEVSLQIQLSDNKKPGYWISICFEDIKDPMLCECAHVDIDLSAYEAEMKGLIASALINDLM